MHKMQKYSQKNALSPKNVSGNDTDFSQIFSISSAENK